MSDTFDNISDSSATICLLCNAELVKREICDQCHHMVCMKCAKTYWKSAKRGKLFQKTMTLCPFCRTIPSANFIKRYNNELGELMGGTMNCCVCYIGENICCSCSCCNKSNTINVSNIPIMFDTKYYYAWCIRCNKVKEAFSKTCADEEVHIKNFICTSCQSFNVKICPQCKIQVYKVSGCNHIQCVCGAHWCFVCGYKGKSQKMVYKHMLREHGSYWS